jgi:hypothetical protein
VPKTKISTELNSWPLRLQHAKHDWWVLALELGYVSRLSHSCHMPPAMQLHVSHIVFIPDSGATQNNPYPLKHYILI